MNLILPAPQPSEIVECILTRVSLTNGLKSIESTLVGQKAKRNLEGTYASVISMLYGIEVTKVVECNTVIPYMQALNSQGRMQQGGSVPFDLDLRRGSLGQVSEHQFCAACYQEDIEWHGFSFIRRHHQLVGVARCTKHDAPLRQLQGDLVDLISGQICVDEQPIVNQLLPCDASNRFSAAVIDLLDLQKASLPFWKIGDAIRSVAKTKGFLTSASGEGQVGSLGAFIANSNDANERWVKEVLPLGMKKNTLSIESQINLAVTGRSTTYAVLVIMAYLFDDTDQILNVLTGQNLVSGFQQPSYVESKSIQSEYVETGGNFKEMSARLGLRKNSVRLRCNRVGLFAPDSLSPSRRDLLAAVRRGALISELMKSAGDDTDWLLSFLVCASSETARTVLRAVRA